MPLRSPAEAKVVKFIGFLSLLTSNCSKTLCFSVKADQKAEEERKQRAEEERLYREEEMRDIAIKLRKRYSKHFKLKLSNCQTS